MLACIACPPQLEVEEDGRANPWAKCCCSQIKNMALKLSGASRQCRQSSRSGDTSNRGRKVGNSPADVDAACENVNRECNRRVSPISTQRDFHTSSGRGMDPLHDSARASNGDPSMSEISGLDRLPSRSVRFLLVPEDEEPREWVARVDPGVIITFISLPQGGNDLKRIRFSREVFDKIQAQQWWGENCDRIMELYNVPRSSRRDVNLNTPRRSADERNSVPKTGSARDIPATCSLNVEAYSRHPGKLDYAIESPEVLHPYDEGSTLSPRTSIMAVDKEDVHSVDASSRDEASVAVSNAGDMKNEWVEQDEPGVYITVRAFADGKKELGGVRFSRRRFGQARAKIWWQENKERVQTQYLCNETTQKNSI